MPESLNLITADLEKRHSYGKATFYLKIIVIIGLEILIISIAAVLSSIFVNTEKLGLVNSRLNSLAQKAQSLERTESRLVLVQDRTEKVKNVLSVGSVYLSAEQITTIIKNSKGISRLSNLEINNKMVNLNLIIDSAENLEQLMTVLVSSGYFSEVNIGSLDYKQDSIKLSLNLVTK